MDTRAAAKGRYLAFISYAHADAGWARWLHRRVETYRLPTAVPGIGDKGAKIGRVFLDRSELATSGDLSSTIADALARSDNLLLVCSPAAARSRWVGEEVRRFRAAGKGDRIFCLIVDGDPARRDEGACFPPKLLETDGEPVEPLAADVRPGADGRSDALLKVVSGLIDVPFDTLRRRELVRRQRRLAIVAAVSTALLVLMTALAISAVLARREAERQEQTATRTAGFLRSLFDGANPERTGGRELTLREVVDRAADDALRSQDLAREPQVRATLLTVLAEVYGQIGLAERGLQLMGAADATRLDDPAVALDRARATANLAVLAGDDARLDRALRAADAITRTHRDLNERFGPYLLVQRGLLFQGRGNEIAAEHAFIEARRRSLSRDPPDIDVATTALLAAATADIDGGREARGERRLHQVIMERRALGTPNHPDVLTALNSLGAARVRQGDPAGARKWFERALPLQRRILGDASLDVALTRNNLGRVLLEQRQPTAALAQLEAAASLFKAQNVGEIDTLAHTEDSRGLALGALRRGEEARRAFERGLAIARANEMPKEVELLIDRAELECRLGDSAAGLRLAGEAGAALTRFALTEPWRRARVDSVTGGCLLAAGQRDAAARLIRASTPAVLARWPRGTLFGDTAAALARRVGR